MLTTEARSTGLAGRRVNGAIGDYGGGVIRVADLRSPRSQIAELTRRASTTSDLVEGRWAHLLIDPFLACVTATKTFGMGWGESLLRQDSPHYVPCAMCQPRGSLRGLCPLMRAPPRAARDRAAAVSEGCRGVPCHVLSVAEATAAASACGRGGVSVRPAAARACEARGPRPRASPARQRACGARCPVPRP